MAKEKLVPLDVTGNAVEVTLKKKKRLKLQKMQILIKPMISVTIAKMLKNELTILLVVCEKWNGFIKMFKMKMQN